MAADRSELVPRSGILTPAGMLSGVNTGVGCASVAGIAVSAAAGSTARRGRTTSAISPPPACIRPPASVLKNVLSSALPYVKSSPSAAAAIAVNGTVATACAAPRRDPTTKRSPSRPSMEAARASPAKGTNASATLPGSAIDPARLAAKLSGVATQPEGADAAICWRANESLRSATTWSRNAWVTPFSGTLMLFTPYCFKRSSASALLTTAEFGSFASASACAKR